MSFMPSLLSLNPGMLGAAASDADVVTWAAAVVTNGGTVSAGRLALVSTMVAAWKAAGTWTVIDDAWLLVAENAPQALTSLKQRRLAAAVAAPTFTTDRGYAFNGTTQYVDTLFVPSVNNVAMTGTNMHLSVYERTNAGVNGAGLGGIITGSQNMLLVARAAVNVITVQLNSQSIGPGGDPITDSRGFTVGSRNGTLAADVTTWKNGLQVAPFGQGTLTSALPTMKIYIGARADASNVAGAFRTSTVGFASVGAGIPAAQQPAFYSSIQSHMTAVGAQV